MAGNAGRNDPRLGDPETLDTAIKREFLVQAFLLNLGILTLCVGVMVLYFLDRFDAGAGLLIVGTFSLLATARRYRSKAPSS